MQSLDETIAYDMSMLCSYSKQHLFNKSINETESDYESDLKYI